MKHKAINWKLKNCSLTEEERMKNSILEDIYMIEYDVWENIPESEQYLNINEAFQEAVEKLSETLTDEQKTLLNEIVGLKTEE